jgi:putative molybdopterin biosynthesis protein
VLLDSRLAKLGVPASAIAGYSREEFTHMGVAVAVKSGLADVGLGIEPAAAALGLGFVPVETEDYDLVMLEEFAASELGSLVLATVGSGEFAAAVSRLPGYDASRSGAIKRRSGDP